MRNESEIPVLIAEIKDELARLQKVVASLIKRGGPLYRAQCLWLRIAAGACGEIGRSLRYSLSSFRQ